MAYFSYQIRCDLFPSKNRLGKELLQNISRIFKTNLPISSRLINLEDQKCQLHIFLKNIGNRKLEKKTLFFHKDISYFLAFA